MKLKIFNFKNINSTNDTAIRIIKSTNYEAGIIVAERQNKGRGQYGKKWKSYKGNFFVSVFFNLNRIKLSLKQLTKINCLIIKKLLSTYCKKKINIKYPNDLMINKKKICGILQEKIVKSNKNFLIIGIGINLIRSPNIKDYPTTNILDITNKKIKPINVLFNLKKLYENFIPKFNRLNLKKKL